MGYISDFGTRYAAPIWGLGISAMAIAGASLLPIDSAAAANTASGVEVTVNISNQRNTKGQLMVCLTGNAQAFPDCSKDAKSKKKLVPANTKSLKFSGVAPGKYAVAVVHDENRNNKMDLALFLPKEGFAMSLNPKVRMGKPKFKNSVFTVASKNVTQNIKMKYIF